MGLAIYGYDRLIIVMAKILLFEQNEALADKLASYINGEGHQCYQLRNENHIVDWILLNHPDLVILDQASLAGNAIKFCSEIYYSSSTLLIVTSCSQQGVDQLIALGSGADDFIFKPYLPEEMVARVNAMLRRLQKLAAMRHRVQLLEHHFRVKYADKEVQLTEVEFNLFHLLYSHPHTVFNREDIRKHMYKDHRVVSENTVNSHIRNLRRKLKVISPQHMLITSVYSAGYKYQPCLDQK
ncbi:winged helix-turn-helix domain-containing protein [Pseudoalteromonas luteoviolacea]|uniref:winged helix-turn-helix domain-containing protein n=1 Tax=Pseudoalteromonas luteoviolacea TaxID=43657 RepID=UPI000B128B77|nr:winged helix-turn-helix domain-containing protein [Pseudoalteromonas luteoviolacea]MBQ4878060.1 winged helix-turn-helix domain-containing protein [Pseudoalteromonas luteoviolacea]MBQ4907086.1 winged helix-turn-helix domain-containing protein [Pseudoalteromonas luteoviolacea]